MYNEMDSIRSGATMLWSGWANGRKKEATKPLPV